MPFDPRKVKILLAEDAVVMRRIEKKALIDLGFTHIVEAEDGQAAIEKLKTVKGIGLIISDWNMPGCDGYELLAWVRKTEPYKNIPFLMATGQGDKKQERKAIDAGVSSFVAKPFDGDELKTKIEEAFGIESEEDIQTVHAPRVAASGKVILKVAHIQIMDHLVLGVLKNMIEEQEVAPKYFELETRCMNGWNPVETALEKGTVDAACILAPIAMDLYNYGVPIKLILLAHKNGSIFVRGKQEEYHRPYQDHFKGKRFLIPHKMSIHHMLAHMFFTGIGLHASMEDGDTDNVDLEVVAPIKMPEFLKDNENTSGFMVAEPLGTKAIAAGIAELQFLSSDLWDNHPCCVVVMQENFIEQYTDAVFEFSELLVRAGKFIEKKPETAAEIGVKFLDPDKKLGLKVPILKNVLMEKKGIKTGDLFPDIEALDIIQQYMYTRMGIGATIDLTKFVDTRFAKAAYKENPTTRQPSVFDGSPVTALALLNPQESEDTVTAKSMLNKEGKYLTFALGNQEFGINILKVKEIIGMMAIRSIPQAPTFLKGVINLRDKVIPVMDLRINFNMEKIDYTDRSCIIVLQFSVRGQDIIMGIAVDSVSEVLDIKASEIEDVPAFGAGIDTGYILAMAKTKEGVKILLNINKVFDPGKIDLARKVA